MTKVLITGGEWGNNGNDTTYTGGGGISGRAITGTNYTVSGTVNSSTVKGSFQPS